MAKQVMQILSQPIQKLLPQIYQEDPDDSPIKNVFKFLQFVECDEYMTSKRMIAFNLEYFCNWIYGLYRGFKFYCYQLC
jgi:hypothetical protein